MPVSILNSQDVQIPDTVTVRCRKRQITVTGPRGTLKKDFSHAPIQIKVMPGKNGQKRIRVEVWNGNRKSQAVVRTVCSHIKNLVTGVTVGFKFYLKFVYAHFPINVNISKDGRTIEVRNFIGNRNNIRVSMLHGVQVKKTEDEKDTIEVFGNDLENVSQSAAEIQQKCRVRNKDIRKFLDGIYVSSKTNIDQVE